MFEKRNIASVYTATLMLTAAIVIAMLSGRSYMTMRSPGPDVDRVVPHAGFVQNN